MVSNYLPRSFGMTLTFLPLFRLVCISPFLVLSLCKQVDFKMFSCICCTNSYSMHQLLTRHVRCHVQRYPCLYSLARFGTEEQRLAHNETRLSAPLKRSTFSSRDSDSRLDGDQRLICLWRRRHPPESGYPRGIMKREVFINLPESIMQLATQQLNPRSC